MAERCEYHWFYIKRGDAVVCEACDDPIQNNGRYRALGRDHYISEVKHSQSCGREGIAGYMVMHPTATGEMCEGSVPTCGDCSSRGVAWSATGEGETLTLEPSILCINHQDHGFVRAGKWVPA